MGECNQCAFPVQVPVSALQRDPICQSNGRQCVVIQDGCRSNGEKKRKDKTPIGGSSIVSIGKSGRRARSQVDWCCNCNRQSTCLTLVPSIQACDYWNAQRQCIDCVCWRQCKNCSAFLPRTLEEGLFGNFCVVAHEPPANPSHRRLTLAAHVTEGGHSEREEGGGYATYEGGGSSEYRGGERVGGRYGREFG